MIVNTNYLNEVLKMAFGKGVNVWIFGFLTFLAGLNTLNAVMLWVYKGADLIIEPYLMNSILGIDGMPVTTYFWVSLIATFGFLGLTAFVTHGEPSPYQAILKMIGEVEEGLADNRRKIEAARVGLFAKLEADRMERQQLFDTVNANIGDASKEMLEAVDRQGKFLQKQRAELEDVKARLETLERELTLPKPKLSSQNAPEEIK